MDPSDPLARVVNARIRTIQSVVSQALAYAEAGEMVSTSARLIEVATKASDLHTTIQTLEE